MSIYSDFCRDLGVPLDYKFIANWEDSQYIVQLSKDDDTACPLFTILEISSNDRPPHNVGDNFYCDLTNLEEQNVMYKGSSVESWDYLHAVKLHKHAEAAALEYNEYISKKPDFEFKAMVSE